MARRQLVITCSSCDSPLRSDVPFCEACGRPAPWATHEERIAWEVRQWRASKAREPETSARMMLVRTDDGLVPVPDRPIEYTWDQPLHPERENPARVNPHAATRPAPTTANGNGRPMSDHGTARSAPQEEPVHALTAVPTPAPPHDETPPEAETAPPIETQVHEVTTALVPRPRSDVEPVTISKKAVAVAVALVVCLPFGGKIVGLVKGTPAGKPVATTAGGPVQALPRPLGDRAGFSQISADAARYAVVISNPNRNLTARGITITIAFRDRGGHLLGTQLERVAWIPGGGSVAVAGETGVAGTVARIEPRLTVGAFDSGAADRVPSVVGVRMSRSGGAVVVRATLAGRAARDVRVVVVHFDRAGHVLGGDFTYIDVPTSRTTTAVVSTAQAPRVARVRVYVLPAR